MFYETTILQSECGGGFLLSDVMFHDQQTLELGVSIMNLGLQQFLLICLFIFLITVICLAFLLNKLL